VTILVIGYSALDVVVPVAGLPQPDAKSEVSAIRIGGGGPGATAAVCLARLGARVRLITMLGDDVGAEIQRQELEFAGVDTRLVRTARGHRSAQAVILVDEAAESRTILWTRGDLPRIDPAQVDPDWVDGCDLLYHDGHEPAAACRLAERARSRGVPVVMDAGSVRAGSEDLVTCSTDVISSRRFAPDLTGHEDVGAALRELRARGPRRVAMTFGEAGVVALAEDGDELVRVPAFAVPVRDTTGAGDAYHAGYAFALARGDGFVAALEFGAAVAALKCRRWGGRAGLPTLAEAEDLRAGGPRRPERPDV
jgi:sugar/nucleoside kinase (ribokinase family)